MPPKVLKIFFEMQSQGTIQKKVVKRICFIELQNFSFFSFKPFLFLNLIIFLKNSFKKI
jgi:hypothetical protein